MRIPKEHGAWAMLYVPFVLGVAASGAAILGHLAGLALLLGAITGLFLGRESLLASWRQRDRGQPYAADGRTAAWQLGGAGVCGLLLLALHPPLALVPMGLGGAAVLGIHLVQMRRREARTVLGEILAIFGLTLAAPAAYLVGTGEWRGRSLALWALCILFFASSVFHVKLRLLAMQPKRVAARDGMRRASAAYHGLLLAGLIAFAAVHRVHPLLVLAFLPVVARAFAALSAPPGRVDLRRAGFFEIGYSLNFLLFATLAFAGSPAS